jgi:hypothetical protein
MEYKSTFVLFTVMSIALLAATIVVSYGSQLVQAVKPTHFWCLTTIGDGTVCVADKKICVEAYNQNPTAFESKCHPGK